jgi:hypothetical protein
MPEGGTKSVVRFEQAPSGGVLAFQNSGGALQLPNGQALANGVQQFVTDWDHE